MTLKRDKYGSYVVEVIPSEDALNKYYRDKYFDGHHTNYPGQYTDDEIEYLHFKDKILEYYLDTEFPNIDRTLLDIGCGEGFTLNYFYKRGYSCYGVDFSRRGIDNQHPHLLEKIHFQQTNIVTNDYFPEKKFDVVVGNGILEHVTNKDQVLQSIHSKLIVGGCFFALVPNDFNPIQHLYMGKNGLKMEECPWFAPPEHLTYFNADSLSETVESFGFKTIAVMTDFPIDMFLLSEHTDYYSNDSGKSAHLIRVAFLNLISKDIRKAVDVCTAMANTGVGRCLMGIFSKH